PTPRPRPASEPFSGTPGPGSPPHPAAASFGLRPGGGIHHKGTKDTKKIKHKTILRFLDFGIYFLFCASPLLCFLCVLFFLFVLCAFVVNSLSWSILPGIRRNFAEVELDEPGVVVAVAALGHLEDFGAEVAGELAPGAAGLGS